MAFPVPPDGSDRPSWTDAGGSGRVEPSSRVFRGGGTGPRRRTWPLAFAITVIVALLGAGWLALARFQPLGGPTQSPHPIAIAGSWASQDVVLSTARPSATLTVTFTYSGTSQEIGPWAVALAPRDARPTSGGGPSLDPAFALVDPAVQLDAVQNGQAQGPPCAAPCEVYLRVPACSSSTGTGPCTSSFDVHLTLVDAAGRDTVALTFRTGMTEFGASALPADFKVTIGPVTTPSGSPAAGAS